MQFLFAQTIEISCTHHNRLILDNIREKFLLQNQLVIHIIFYN